TFLLGAAGTQFGHEYVVSWQALGVTAPLVLLLTYGRTLVPFGIGMMGLIATSAVTTAIVAVDTPEVAAVIPVATAPAVIVAAALFEFRQALGRFASRLSAEQAAAA